MYVVPDRFTGWVTVYYKQKGAPELSESDIHYIVRIDTAATVRTSADLRQDDRGARFVSTNGKPIPREGIARRIWGWTVGDANSCSPFQSFFVGTSEQYKKVPQNPVLENIVLDCSKLTAPAAVN